MAEDAGPPRCRRVGILGYGRLGQFLAGQLLARGPPLGLALAFVWARDGGALEGLPPALRLRDLSLLPQMAVDLVVEVAHPCVAQEHGEDILAHADFMLGSPTALADPLTEQRLRGAAARGGHTLYIPRGALWGCEDIRRMDDSGTLAALKVTMTKAPQSFRLQGWLRERLVAAVAAGGREVLYEGPLRPLCPLAPNNVNTMAAAAVAAPSLGFDGVRACLVADPSIPDWHVVEVEVTSVGDEGRALSVTSTRRNPAAPGAVTGAATRDAFWSSLLGRDRAPGGTLKAVTPPPGGCASTFRRGACREEGPRGFSGRGAKHAGRKVRGRAGCFRWGPRGTLGVVVPPARCRRCGRRRPGRRRGRFGGHRRAPQTPPPSPPRHRGHVRASPGRGGRAGAVPRAAAPGALRRPRAQQRPAAPLLHPGGCRRHLQEVGARRPPQPPPQRFGDGQLRRERDHGRAAEPGAGGRLVGQAPVAGAAGTGTNHGLHPQRALPRLTGLRGVAAAPQALAGRPAAGRHLLQPGLQAPRSRPHRRRGRAQGFPPGFPRPRALRGFPRRPPGCGGGRRLAQPRVTRRGDKDDGWHHRRASGGRGPSPALGGRTVPKARPRLPPEQARPWRLRWRLRSLRRGGSKVRILIGRLRSAPSSSANPRTPFASTHLSPPWSRPGAAAAGPGQSAQTAGNSKPSPALAPRAANGKRCTLRAANQGRSEVIKGGGCAEGRAEGGGAARQFAGSRRPQAAVYGIIES